MTHSESRWQHAICTPCFERHYPGRQPSRVVDDDVEICCVCGAETDAGIYFRGDPFAMQLTFCPRAES